MKTTLVEVMENGSEDKFDAQSHSATVFYTGMGGGGFSGSSDGFGSGFTSSSPSSTGSAGFGSSKPSGLGSGGRIEPICDMGYNCRPDPCGPLSRAVEIQIKPIEIDISPIYKPMELDMPKLDTGLLCKALENMDLPKVPSNIGSAGYSALPDYLRESTTRTMRLAEIATAGCPKVPSTLGSAGSRLESNGSQYRIFDEEKQGAPLVRLDLKPHEFGEKHLHFGEKVYTGRKGNEAADIFAHIFKSNSKIKLPWEN